MNPSSTPTSVSPLRRAVAGVMLLAALAQILLFYAGLLDPVRRAASLWGKSLEERRGVVWGPGRSLKAIAEQFPVDAKIYLLDPQALLLWNGVYYFYPRVFSCTMSNRAYRTNEEFAMWNERPSPEWFAKTNFTHVITFKNGGRVWQVTPGKPLYLNAN